MSVKSFLDDLLENYLIVTIIVVAVVAFLLVFLMIKLISWCRLRRRPKEEYTLIDKDGNAIKIREDKSHGGRVSYSKAEEVDGYNFAERKEIRTIIPPNEEYSDGYRKSRVSSAPDDEMNGNRNSRSSKDRGSLEAPKLPATFENSSKQDENHASVPNRSLLHISSNLKQKQGDKMDPTVAESQEFHSVNEYSRPQTLTSQVHGPGNPRGADNSESQMYSAKGGDSTFFSVAEGNTSDWIPSRQKTTGKEDFLNGDKIIGEVVGGENDVEVPPSGEVASSMDSGDVFQSAQDPGSKFTSNFSNFN